MANILVVGVGCIGSVYACILAASSQSRVTCVCRSNYEAVKQTGLRVSSPILGDLRSSPTVVETVVEAVEQSHVPFDFVLVCTKATQSATKVVIEQIRPAFTSDRTSLVLIQNGLGVERPFHLAFPDTTIISGVAYLPTTQILPATFVHSEIENLHLGLYPCMAAPPKHAALEAFAELVRRGGATATVHKDIQEQRWCKIVANGTVNPICALSQCRDRELVDMTELGTTLIKNVMQEVAAVAASAGYGHIVTSAVVNSQLARTLSRSSPGVQPSMMADALARRELEVQAVVGEVVRIGGKNGVSIPRLITLYVLLEGLNSALQKDRHA
jgi:2-dehydropantoate 2-reductase